MQQKEFELLVEKFLQENLAAEELDVFLAEIKAGRNLGILDSVIAEKLDSKAFDGLNAGVGEAEVFNAAMRKAAEYENAAPAKIIGMPTSKKYTPMLRMCAAAVILLVCLSSAFYFLYRSKPAQVASIKPALPSDIAPGGNKATLTLANGSVVVLNDQQNGTVSNQGNTKVIKLNDGQVTYNAGNGSGAQIVYNTIATPRGGKYKVVLADGSNVWLNAASSIRFPTAFAGKDREVEITGEVYFEVAKNKAMPFVVKASNVKVEVLGTHFNVMLYNDEPSVKTTLLEGSVKVSSGGNAATIKPGQQAKITAGSNSISIIDDADTDEAIAWKNDMFVFNNAGIEAIMRQIARWYDVEVRYDGPVTTDHFTGKVSRNENVAQVLKILALSDIHFTITGKKIIVKS